MKSTGLKIGSALLCIAFIPAVSGCAHRKCDEKRAATGSAGYGGWYGSFANSKLATAFPAGSDQDYVGSGSSGADNANWNSNNNFNNGSSRRGSAMLASSGVDMPLHAKSGECYAQLYVPPEYETVTERIVVREASEKLEIIPAHYDWVEEKVLVKEASTKLVEIPAQFDVQNRVVETSPGHATWLKADADHCSAHGLAGTAPQDIFCFVSEPSETMTIKTQRLVKPASVKEVHEPAEYQTIRKYKLVRPASTRKVSIPAEYKEIKKSVMVSAGRMDWERVDCDSGAFEQGKQVRPVNYKGR